MWGKEAAPSDIDHLARSLYFISVPFRVTNMICLSCGAVMALEGKLWIPGVILAFMAVGSWILQEPRFSKTPIQLLIFCCFLSFLSFFLSSVCLSVCLSFSHLIDSFYFLGKSRMATLPFFERLIKEYNLV